MAAIVERGGASLRNERQFEFQDADFARVRRLIHARAGISLGEHKREMVYSRLVRRLRSLGQVDFHEYLDDLERATDNPEWEHFTNALTTNLTAFFREPHHFPILADFVRQRPQPVSVWCCAASTGEEPYSIAMTLADTLGRDFARADILATDIDTQVLERARQAVYPFERVAKLDADVLKRHLLRGKDSNQGLVRVRPELVARIRFETLNLLDAAWRIGASFDAIFCRNVMIYFDKPTQATILRQFVTHLKPGGLLFAGHSENFTYISQDFRLRGQTVYECVRRAA